MKIIGICGQIGHGKDTLANTFATNLYYRKISFAGTLKDICATLFGWPRNLLEGDTVESRLFRESTDEFWEKKLGIKGFNPRYALQYVGTDVFRHHFHSDIWSLAIEKRIESYKIIDEDIVISDVRFPNEADMIKSRGGHLIRIIRKDKTSWWYDVAVKANAGCGFSRQILEEVGIHESEYALAGYQEDFTVHNDKDISDLEAKAKEIHCFLSIKE